MDRQLATRNWATRPDDERFKGLGDWRDSIERRNAAALESPIRFRPTLLNGDIAMNNARLTNWSAGQISSMAGIPQRTLARMSPQLALDALTELLPDEPQKALVRVNGDTELLAITSPTYGRIWDGEVAALACEIADKHGMTPAPEWKDGYSACYASDRDCFTFLISGGSIVQAGRTARGTDDTLHRGIFLWNSEVGSATFGLDAFYFRAVCGNFSIFGFEEFGSVRIRHSAGAPSRFAETGTPAILAWLDGSARPTEELIANARRYALPAETPDVYKLTNKFGWTPRATDEAIALQIGTEHECRTLWDLHNGFTARAKLVAHRNTRLEQEKAAGDLLKLVA